jgi:hypothetical protein
VPITAKLSKLFYERLGEQIANELVDWFNAVDATYRADLRELNNTNFARFEAKLDQRLAELETRLNAQWEKRFSDVRVELHSQLSDLKAELIQWMFLFWAGTALAGLLLR